MQFQENFKRDEKILILPHNTLRYVDAMCVLDIYKEYKIPYPSFEENLYKTVIRSQKDLSKIYNVNDKLKKQFKENWAFYYDIAPRTNMYEYINILYHQKFVKDAVILFSDKNAKDAIYDNEYYDGTIDSLEKFISNNGFTSIFLDDVMLIDTMMKRKKIDLSNKSFFISKVGYNYEFNKKLEILMPKEEFYNIQQELENSEIGIVNLFDFSDEVINKIANQKGRIKNDK